jgi:hypothetical protein
MRINEIDLVSNFLDKFFFLVLFVSCVYLFAIIQTGLDLDRIIIKKILILIILFYFFCIPVIVLI